ncbi:extracellular solute-binding protein [Bacillus sp. 1P06AnD]|uniref:extracellular solute-binding protein n=1 Tax=Bacillus sp. 1P06AnD TaxID=3132208 RepID=UPI0039A3DA62
MSGKKSRDIFREQLQTMKTSIREQILEGTYKIGEYLPSELVLAETYGLSKNSVRKGLEDLVGEGLIVKKSRIGNQVIAVKPSDQMILRVGYYPSLINEVKFNDLISLFELDHPNIKVKTIALPYENYQLTVRDFFLNDMIDVITVNFKDFYEFKDMGESLFEPMEYNTEIYPFLQKSFDLEHTKKKVFVCPFVFSPIIFCYNKAHFDNGHIPYPDSSWKWEDALGASKVLMEEDHDDKVCGLYFHPFSLNRWPIFMMQNGVRFEKGEDGTIQFPYGELLESANFIRTMFEEQNIQQTFLSDNNRDAEQLFVEHKTSMIIASYFTLNEIRKHSIEYDIAPLPYFQYPKTLLLIIGFAVNKHSTRKHAAEQFVSYMNGEKVQEYIRINTLSLPAVKRVAERQGGEQVYKPSRFQLFREIIPSFCLYTDLGLNSTELAEVRNELRLHLAGASDNDSFYERLNMKLSQPARMEEIT